VLALIVAAICVLPGSTSEVTFELPFTPLYGGTIYSDDPYIAEVTGRPVSRSGLATVLVEGRRKGRAKVWMRYVSGISIYNTPVGEVIVDEALGVTVSPAHAVVGVQTPVLLSALTTGPDVVVAWFEGNRYLGLGHNISVTLPLGLHRVRAEGANPCGIVASESEIRVVKPRRRTLRH
jgi:hypothetical protein